MRASVYARLSVAGKKSRGPASESESINRQIDLATAFIASKSWTLDLAHVYKDDDVSGTQVRRPGLDALLAAAGQKRRAFDAVVVMDLDRLAREQVFAPQTLDALINDAGIEVWEYSTGQKLEYGTAEQKLLTGIKLFGGSHYVQQIKRKTAEAMLAKRKRGAVVGKVPLGYTAVRETRDGFDDAWHVVDPDQAQIVVSVFEVVARDGYKVAADTLNSGGVPNPGATDGKWSASAVREVVDRDIYNGVLVSGKKTWVRRGGGKPRQEAQPETDWLTVPAPHLRIVPEDLWAAVRARLEQAAAAYIRGTDGGTLAGKPEAGTKSERLLTGFLRCGCGAKLSAMKRGARVTWACSAHRNAEAKCSVSAGEVPAGIETSIIWTMTNHILTQDLLDRCIADLAERAAGAPDRAADQRAVVTAELARVELELTRLGDLAASGAAVETFLAGIKAREGRRRELQQRLDALDGQAQASAQDAEAVDTLREVINDWQGYLGAEPAQGRQILRKLGVERIPVTRLAHGGWSWRVCGTFERAFGGRVYNVAVPADEAEKWDALVDEVNTVAAELDAIRPGRSNELLISALDAPGYDDEGNPIPVAGRGKPTLAVR